MASRRQPSQDQLLAQFRERVSDIVQPHHDDHFLLRWLRARAFNLDKSEDMLRKSMAWRAKWKVDSLVDDWEPPEVLTKYFPGGHSGVDKEGFPVWVVWCGRIDMKGMSMSAHKHDIIRYGVRQVEQVYRIMEQQSKKTGRRIDQVVLVDDLEGFTMRKLFEPGMELLLKLLAIVEANYPESLKQCYIVNAPRIWGVIYNVCKPFMSEDTKQKITILGRDWREKLHDIIEPDQLPQHWGGTAIDPDGDPYCQSKICIGGDVPHSYYLREQQMVDPEKLVKVTVAAGSSLDLEFKVNKANSVLKWIFKTESHDLAFGVSRASDNGAKPTVVMPISRVNCQNIPESGLIECEKPGTYLVHFDNKFSWMTSKKLSYCVEVILPNEEYGDSKANHIAETILDEHIEP